MQGGVGDFTRELGLALNGLGVTVKVVTSVQASQPAETVVSPHGGGTLKQDGRQITVYPVIAHWDFSSWQSIAALLKHTEPQILNIQYQTAAYQMHPAVNFLPWRLRFLRYRPRVVATFHDLKLPYLFPKAGPVRRWVTSALIRGCDATIVTNVEDRLQAERLGAHDPHLLPIGSNIHPQAPPNYDRQKWRERWGVGEDEVLVCYFGFLNESKGGETLFRALAHLVDSGERIRLLMIGGKVGSSDPANVAFLQKMEALIGELNVEGTVAWTGYVDGPEVSANFWAADVCVLPYRDGVSFRRGTLMAALAHGMPIISTYPRVDTAEVVEGENMALVPPDDPQALADKIREVTASDQLRQRLARGATGLSRLFSWEAIAEDTYELYEQILNART